MNYFKKRVRAFRDAGNGVLKLFTTEAHAKIHLVAAIVAVILAFILGCSYVEWCLIIICIGGVFGAEAVNTAIEYLADKITREQDPLIGVAKDVAAAAVLMFAMASLVIGLIIFLSKII